MTEKLRAALAAFLLAAPGCASSGQAQQADPAAPPPEKAPADATPEPAPAEAETSAAVNGHEKLNPYTGNEEAIAEGRKLFLKYSCYGCHGTQGGGGMGKPISDDEWVAGGDDKSVFEVVRNGTVGGMPPFKDILTEDETWKVIAFVRSLYQGDSAKIVW